MSAMDIAAFQSTLQTTNDWLNELTAEMGRDDSQQAYRVLRAVLIALRDRLTAGDSWLVPKDAIHRYRIVEHFVAVEATSPPAHVRGRDEK